MSGTQELQKVLDLFEARIAAVESKVGGVPPPPATGGGAAPQVAAFDAYTAAALEPFVAACAALGAPEATQCGVNVTQAWAAMRGFIVAASLSKKPANFPGDCMNLVKPCQAAMQQAAQDVARGDWEWHQKTVSEGVQCCSWLVTSPGPKDVVESYVGGQDFWANKIRVKYKKTDPKHVAFCDTFKTLMVELMSYVKEHHFRGVAFNPRGGDISKAPVASAPAASAPTPAATSSAKAGLASALASLQTANDLQSKGLKKVSKDQQTWRKEFSGTSAPIVTKKATPVRKQTVTKGPPSKKLLGKKWLVQNYSKSDGVITIDVGPEGPKCTVYIACCYEATLVINGKCNGVVLDASQKCQVVFDSVIAAFEVINCKSVKVQCKGLCPSVAIDKTDGMLTYLSKETLAVTSFLTSKSSDMQVSFPNESGDMVEAPIPEQFRHTASLVGGKPVLSTDVSELYSH